MKIAIITHGSPNHRTGLFNDVHSRIVHLMKMDDVQLDVYILRYERQLDKKASQETFVDGVNYHNLYVHLSLFRYLASYKFKLMPYPGFYAINSFIDKFKDYDLLSAHAIGGMQIAEKVKEKYGIPYVITWHGSDVHTDPQANARLMNLTRKVMANADWNFFVSKALLETSNQICVSEKKEVLYSGVSNDFKKYNESVKASLKKKYGVENHKVVAFLGNVISIKNVLSLPLIFKKVATGMVEDSVKFWIIGDGKQAGQLKNDLEKNNIDYKMFGMVKPNIVPDLMNCIDVLVLPSINEGLPLVTEEALLCGTNVVGSDVGGISEVIGKENVYKLDDSFIHNISKRIIEILDSNEKPKPLPTCFDWDICSSRELECYKQIINSK